MNNAAPAFADRAAALRLAFDRAFAEPDRAAPAASDELLDIVLGAVPYALRLGEIAGVYADQRITPLPGSPAALSGIAGLRGAIVPVYDLAVLLGHAGQTAPRWLAVAAARPVGFAFAALQGHRRLARDAIVPHRDCGSGLVRELARDASGQRPIVHLPSVLDTVARLAAAPPHKER